MKKTVDSTKKMLQPAAIMLNARDSSGTLDDYDEKVSMPAIMAEFSQPNAEVAQFGNSLYVVHKGDGKDGFFKFFSADTPENEPNNFKQFVIWAKSKVGMQNLITEFKDQEYLNLFSDMYANAPFQNMGYQVYESKDGKTRVFLNLGEGEA